jgi:hypothetical protein
MRSVRPSGLRALAASACCCLALAACRDDLTGPSAQAHPAGGRMWVAVTPPRGLPDDRTWLPFVSARKGEDAPAALRVQALRDEGRRLRRAGDLDGALKAEERAAETAAGGMARVPDRATMAAALESLDAWTREAEGVLEAGAVPELGAGIGAVRAARADAAAALAAGDTMAAVGHVARAATAAREQAPAAVALRIFARAEAVVRERQKEMPKSQAQRAERLLRWAREAVLTGEPERAFRRAVYALQLVERYGSDRPMVED